MSEIDELMSEREEIEMLLPWYVTGRLDKEDAARVEAYLAQHPELQHQLSLIREEQQENVALNEALPVPPLPSADELMARLSGDQSRMITVQSLGHGLFAAISGFFEAPSPGAVRWAAAAAAVVIIAQAAVLGVLVTREEASYIAASGPGEEANGASIALVSFADGATPGAITSLLEENQLRIVDGPLPGGFFRVRFDGELSSDEDRRQLLARLGNRRDVIKLVLPSQ